MDNPTRYAQVNLHGFFSRLWDQQSMGIPQYMQTYNGNKTATPL
jgi:hypothetical protein